MKFLLCTVVALVLLIPAGGKADEIGDLRAELAALAERVAALEAENRELKSGGSRASSPGAAAPARQPEQDEPAAGGGRFRAVGDFRYRFEEIDVEGSRKHRRSRIRARAGIVADVAEDLEVGFGLSTGGDSPTSSTRTLGAGGSKKPIALDLAYVDWAPRDGLHVLAGKFHNPLFQVPGQTLLWDDEWRPEGIAVRYENEHVFATFISTWLESDSLAPARELAAGGHAGIYRSLGTARLTAGLGYFDIGTAGKGTFHGADDAFLGNSRSCTGASDAVPCMYLLDYREVEAFAALDLERETFAARLYGHYVENLDAERFERGWTLGGRVSPARRDLPLQFDYFYRALGADAVYAQLTDSDFGGGGSDTEGHYFRVSWFPGRDVQLALTWFDNRVGADAGAPLDYDRVQLDANFAYR